jgi:[NiFe] hydrogenase assembly HybE family chaperone
VTSEALEIGRVLADHFVDIHQRVMHDTPMSNNDLQVESIGFQVYSDQVLGIVITPWFMNLVLTARPGETLPEGRIGDRRSLKMPAGSVDFMIGELPDFGRLDTCSLFSPMFDFADHQTAHDTALAVIDKLMQVPPEVVQEPAMVSRRALLRGKMGGSK